MSWKVCVTATVSAFGAAVVSLPALGPALGQVMVNTGPHVRDVKIVRSQPIAQPPRVGDIVLPPPIFAERNLGAPAVVYGRAKSGSDVASRQPIKSRDEGRVTPTDRRAEQNDREYGQGATQSASAQSRLPSEWRENRSGLDGPRRERVSTRRRIKKSENWKEKIWGHPG